MGRNDLTDTQWRRLEPHLPTNPTRGHAFKDHRTVINGILWQHKTGAPWRDVPERYGPWRTLHALQARADAAGDIDWDGVALDSTHVKALRKRGIVCVCLERADAERVCLKRGLRGGRPPGFDAEAYNV
jgi:transposase